MERIEELLMDMIDDGPTEALADAGSLPALDSTLPQELETMRGQSLLLKACAEPINASTLAALVAQQATLSTSLLGSRIDVPAAVLWSSAVVVVATFIGVAASMWSAAPQPQFEGPARVATAPSTTVVSKPETAPPALRQQASDTYPTHAQPPALLEGKAEREVLVHRRDELVAAARRATPDQAYRLYRDIYRVSNLLHDVKAARSALRSALALAEAAGMAGDVEQCRLDLKNLDQR
ncbi:hypothetical protein BH10BAC6_BH10BAC6_02780 [soil metagenome]